MHLTRALDPVLSVLRPVGASVHPMALALSLIGFLHPTYMMSLPEEGCSARLPAFW